MPKFFKCSCGRVEYDAGRTRKCDVHGLTLLFDGPVPQMCPRCLCDRQRELEQVTPPPRPVVLFPSADPEQAELRKAFELQQAADAKGGAA